MALNLGQRIKELRLERKLSLYAVSKSSGISMNALRRIERNLTSPTISTLYKIAEVFNVPMMQFFQENVSKEKVVYCQKEQNVQLPFLRGIWEGLGCNQFSGGIQPFLLTLEAGGGSGRLKICHSGIEFVYCLEGQIEYEIEGARYLLEPGDTLMFLGNQQHRWRNAGKERCRVLIVLFDLTQRSNRGEVSFLEGHSDEPNH